jgi:hypothetical protein
MIRNEVRIVTDVLVRANHWTPLRVTFLSLLQRSQLMNFINSYKQISWKSDDYICRAKRKGLFIIPGTLASNRKILSNAINRGKND